MERQLHILFLEDEPKDVEQVQALLASEGLACQIRRVETRQEFESALFMGGFDLIFSDNTLPAYDGLSALELSQAICPEVPFIFVSGTLGEEVAIESLKKGATDYVLKQRLQRLAPVTRRALREATERQECARVEEALGKSAERFRALIENSADAIVLVGPDATILYGSPSTTRLLGYNLEEFEGRNALELIHQDDQTVVLSRLALSLEQPGVGVEVLARVRHKDGGWRWLEGLLTNLLAQSSVQAIVGNYHDVTERKAAEEARWRQALTFNTIHDGIFFTDAQRRIVDWNPAAERITGYAKAEVLGKTADLLYRPEEAATIVAKISEGLQREGRWAGEIPFIRKDGSEGVVETVVVAMLDKQGKVVGALSTSHDITRRKAGQAALQEANVNLELRVLERTAELERVKTRLEAIFNNSGDGILLLDLTKGIQQTNIAFDKLFNTKPGAASGLPLAALVHPANLARLEQVIQEVAHSHQAQQIELVAQFQNQTSFEAEINISPVNFSDQAVTSLVCIVRDISERKKAHQLIAEERNLLRTLIDAVPDYIYIKDSQHRMVLNNISHARSLPTQTPEKSIGKTDFELFPAEMAAKFTADEVELFRTGQPILNTEERSVGQDGSTIWALTTKVPLRNLEGEVIGLVGITRDVTRIKTQEEALRTKMAEEQEFQTYLKTLHEITLELSQIDNLNEFYRRAVELGLERFGFERLGLLLYDAENEQGVGTYGTDAEGTPGPEYELRFELDPTGILKRAMENRAPLEFDQLTKLYSKREVIGYGWNAIAILWSGQRGLGWLAADNVIHHKEASKALLDIFSLYASTIGTLLGQKQAEEALQLNQADLQSIIESSDLAFILLDLEDNIRVVNNFSKEFNQKYYGITLEIGHNMLDYVPAEEQPVFRDQLAKIKAGENFKNITELKTGDKTLYIEGRAYPVKTAEGAIIGVNIAYEDITTRKETELQLRFLASLQENMLDAVIAADIQFNIQSWNKGAEHIYGWSEGEVIGKSIFGLIKSQLASGETLEESTKVLVEKGYWSGEALQNRRDGSSVNVLLSIVLLKDKDGNPIGIVAVNRDITERKQAEEALQKTKDQLQAILDYSTSSIFMKDLEGRILLWNQGTANDHGLPFSEAVDKLEEELLPQARSAQYRLEDLQVIEKGIPLTFEEQVKERTFLITKFPIFDREQQVYAIGGISTDITTQKRQEEILKQALHQEQELNELKTNFITVASHEFRTPLSTILTTTENLIAYRQKMDDSQIDKRLIKIQGQVGHLKLIMDDVLILSKMQSGRLEFKPVETDLDAFCLDIIEEFESSPNIQHQLVYTCTPQPLLAQIDPKLMRHILNNLLSNALKYSPEGKDVYFEVSVQGEEFKIEVKDEGIGIPEADLKHLFEPFHRAGNVGTISGTGLGLTITKQSVETHGGTIEVESKVGLGTTFTVTIPFGIRRN